MSTNNVVLRVLVRPYISALHEYVESKDTNKLHELFHITWYSDKALISRVKNHRDFLANSVLSFFQVNSFDNPIYCLLRNRINPASEWFIAIPVDDNFDPGNKDIVITQTRLGNNNDKLINQISQYAAELTV
jgi:hypothetical protein